MMVLYVNYPDRLVVEGFRTALHAAVFLKTLPPGWDGAAGDLYEEASEALVKLNNPEAQMRFLVGIGYPREDVIATVAKNHPSTTPERLEELYAEAAAAEEQLLAKMDSMVDGAEAAVRAEHDLSQTMHDEEGDA